MIQSTLQSYHGPWLRKHHSLACWQLSPAIALKGAGRTKGNASPVGHMLSIWQYLMHPKLKNLSSIPRAKCATAWFFKNCITCVRCLNSTVERSSTLSNFESPRNPVSRDVRANHSSTKRSLFLVVKIARRCFQWIRYSSWSLITKRIGLGDCSAPPGLQWPNVEGPRWTSSRHFELIGTGLSLGRWKWRDVESTKYQGQTDTEKQTGFLSGGEQPFALKLIEEDWNR